MTETKIAKPTDNESNAWPPKKSGNHQPYSTPVMQAGHLRLNIDTARAPGYASDRNTGHQRSNADPRSETEPSQPGIVEHQVALDRRPGFAATLTRFWRKCWDGKR